MASEVVELIHAVRKLDLKKQPSISETLDWARALTVMNVDSLGDELVRDTLSTICKYEGDVRKAEKELEQFVQRKRAEQPAAPAQPPKTGGDKEAKKAFDVLTIYKNHLLAGKSARTAPVAEEDKEYIEDIWLLTAKPVLYVCNVDESSVNTGNAYVEKVKAAVKEENAEVLVISAQIESEIAQLETYEERQMFLDDLGLAESGVNKLIKAAYRLLNLATYFTAGVQEVRAWTITQGFTAPQAAGVIHTDFEKGFIRAEVMAYKDLVEAGSEQKCKELGKLRIEGKEYIVHEGDVMHFRFTS